MLKILQHYRRHRLFRPHQSLLLVVVRRRLQSLAVLGRCPQHRHLSRRPQLRRRHSLVVVGRLLSRRLHNLVVARHPLSRRPQLRHLQSLLVVGHPLSRYLRNLVAVTRRPLNRLLSRHLRNLVAVSRRPRALVAVSRRP